MPAIINLIIWLVAGFVGGYTAGKLFKGDHDLGRGNLVAGALGDVVGALILHTSISA